MAKINFKDQLEASAFSVIVSQSMFKVFLKEIVCEDGQWYVSLKQPLPEEFVSVVIKAIKDDQTADPEKWLKAQAKAKHATPVPCQTEADISVVLEEMKTAANSDPDIISGYEGHDTASAAVFNAEMARDKQLESGQTRAIFWDGKLITLVLTVLIAGDATPEWNFSMSMRSGPEVKQPERVPDEIASMIVKLALGEGYEEVEAMAFFKTIRHFISRTKHDRSDVFFSLHLE